MKTRNGILIALLVATVMLALSCSKNKDDSAQPDQTPLAATVIEDLPADPVVEDPDGGRPGAGTNQFTLFRLSDSTIVPNSDSATTKWDIGFRGTSIIINNSIHGPGTTTGLVAANKLFDDLKKAPEGNYRADSASGNTFGGWYNYNSNSHIISPKPGYLFVIHTNEGQYVKLEILSYYKGAPKEVTSEDLSRYYTFKYIINSGKDSNF